MEFKEIYALCGKKLISSIALIILAFISPKLFSKLLCAYINLESLPFLKIIKFKISKIVGKIYAIKLTITISQLFSIIVNKILIITKIGRILLLKLSNILNLERSPKGILFFCFVFYFYFIF